MEPELRTRLRTAAVEAFSSSGVAFAYLFGSMAEGRAGARSDCDIAVYLESIPCPAETLDLTLALGNRFAAASCIRNVDLVILNVAPLRLRGRIIRQRVVLYSRDELARVAYESLTMREWTDFEMHAQRLDRAFLQAVADGRR